MLFSLSFNISCDRDLVVRVQKSLYDAVTTFFFFPGSLTASLALVAKLHVSVITPPAFHL